MKRYEYGDAVPLAKTFLLAAVPTDPSGVTLKLITPGGGTITASGGSLTHSAVGSYAYSQLGTLEGTWTWRWEGTGTIYDALEGQFAVRATPFY